MLRTVKTTFTIVALIGLLLLGVSAGARLSVHGSLPKLLAGSGDAEKTVNDALVVREALLVPYQALNAQLGTNLYPDERLYVAPDGYIHKYAIVQDVSVPIENTVALAQFCEDRGINFSYYILPSKPATDAELRAVGIPCGREESTNRFVQGLAEQGVTCHDLRGFYRDHDFYSWFYKTDHHWNTEAGLAAARIMAEQLNQDYGYSFDVSRLDDDRFTRTVYPNAFIGEMGFATTGVFGTIEDYVVIEPNYPVNLRRVDPESDIDKTGGFEVMFTPRHLDNISEPPTHTRYYYYLGANNNEVELFDYDVDQGDILLIKDSYAMVLAPFLSLECNHLTLWDVRESTEIRAYLEQHPNIQTVVVAYCVPSVATPSMHDFR